MISEGSCDTEDQSNDCWKFSFDITDINNIFKYIQIENSYFKLHYSTIFLYLWPNKSNLVEHKASFKNICKKFWTVLQINVFDKTSAIYFAKHRNVHDLRL